MKKVFNYLTTLIKYVFMFIGFWSGIGLMFGTAFGVTKHMFLIAAKFFI